MSIVRTLDVFCDTDGCLAWTNGVTEDTAVEARRIARRAGWRHLRGKDLCPECVEDFATRTAP